MTPRRPRAPTASDALPPTDAASTADVNEVRLVGRVTGPPAARELPSGDRVVTLRVTLDRPGRALAEPGRRQVDTIDLACWTTSTREAAAGVATGARIEVHGALRRRFYRAGGATVSRYEVQVTQLSMVVP